MRILFVESKIQQCPSIPLALNRMGHEIACYQRMLEDIEGEEYEKAIEVFLKK